MEPTATIEIRRRRWSGPGGELVEDVAWEVRRTAGSTIACDASGDVVITEVTSARVLVSVTDELELRGAAELALGDRTTVLAPADPDVRWELRVIALREADARPLPGGTLVERELLAAIAAAPDEDGPRMVYADWLMSQPNEVDRVRGELVQVQITLGASPPPERRSALRARERELVALLRPPIVADGFQLSWHRGFLERCTAVVDRFANHAYDAFQVAPIAILDLTYTGGTLGPGLERVDGLAQVRELTIAPRAANVRQLANRVVADLVPRLVGLRRIRVPNMYIGADGVAAILASSACPQLAVVDLGGNEIGPKPLAELVASTRLQPRTLRLAGCDLDPYDIEILARAAWLPELEELDLGDSSLGDRGALALAAVPFQRLRRLALASCGIGARGFAALIRSRHLARLAQLRIHRNPIGDAGAAALAASRLRSIAELDAQACDIGDDGVAALASSPNVRAARRWRLGGNGIGDAGARAILESIHLRDLVELDLSRCPITDEDVLARLADRFGQRDGAEDQ